MKRILITGKNSYIGTSFESYLSKYPEDYVIDTLDMRNENWKDYDFSKYDVVFHVAGIAHVSSNPKIKELYYKVNRDLTIEVAKKAKNDKVKQFIFMSSIIVYGDCRETKGRISINTVPKPKDFYGDSKLQAEIGLRNLESMYFKIVILRPPMIYGKGSKGNYQKLSKFAKITPIFPDYANQRSMLFIDNFCIFVKDIIDYDLTGLYFPQNNEYVNTSELVSLISKIHNKNIIKFKFSNYLIKVLNSLNIVNKIFGNLYYDNLFKNKYSSTYKSLIETIEITESVNKI